MIPYKNRFHGHSSLGYVYKNGRAVRSRLVTIKFVENRFRKEPRIAVVVSKKVLKSAVGRNRIRRRVYEYARLKLIPMKKIYDIVFIISSSEVLNIPHDELKKQLDGLLQQADLF